jgi:two-component system NarL family sensor kinase
LNLTKNSRQHLILHKSNEALAEVIADMRNISFNLMPKTLEEFGLVKAVQEFCKHLLHHKAVQFIIKEINRLPEFTSEMKIDLYRIIQEFINNAIRHGNANKISIFFSSNKNSLKLLLRDNGKGFDCRVATKGMGIQNVCSRVKSHNGIVNIASTIGKGTTYTINIPNNFQV